MSKMLDNYQNTTSSKNLDNAFKKVSEIKDIAGNIIEKQASNMEQTQDLLNKTNDMKFMAKKYEDNAT